MTIVFIKSIENRDLQFLNVVLAFVRTRRSALKNILNVAKLIEHAPFALYV